LKPLSALNSSHRVVVAYNTCNYPPALSFPQLEIQNIIPSYRESIMHNRRFASVWINIRAGWGMRPAIGVVGAFSRLLLGAKQEIPCDDMIH
jgi:hypothetical protein